MATCGTLVKGQWVQPSAFTFCVLSLSATWGDTQHGGAEGTRPARTRGARVATPAFAHG